MSYSLIDLSENAQDNRYPITNDFGLLYNPSKKQISLSICHKYLALTSLILCSQD